MLGKIRSHYILEQIIKENIEEKKYLHIFQYNKNLQKRLNISVKDFKNYYTKRIIIELKPKKELNDIMKYFIRFKPKERKYFHIYFDNNKSEEARNYITHEDKINKIKIVIDSQIKSFNNLFRNCDCLEEINIIRCERKNINNMHSMFEGCSSLIKLDLSNLKTDNVKIMRTMFEKCASLKELNLSNFNTKNVYSMYGMFRKCSSLTNLIINNFDTSNVTNMGSMFTECSSLKSLDLSNFNTDKVYYMNYMFNQCYSLINLNITNFHLNRFQRMFFMFSGCRIDLQNFIKRQIQGFKNEAFL